MSEQKLNRREFFERAAMLGAVAAGAGTFLAACQKGGDAESGGGGGTQAEGGAGGAGGGELTCTDTTGLNEQQIKLRESLNYVDNSPQPQKLCEGCKLYTKPKEAGSCGGCTTVPGPIHPKGYCTAWVAA